MFSALSETEDIGVLASVNGTPITLADVLEISSPQEAQLAVMYKEAELDKQILKLRKEVLESVIARKLVYQDFKAHDFKLPRDFVENNMDVMLKSFHVTSRHEMESILRENGKTMDEFKDRVYENIAVDALIYGRCYREVFVTPKDVFDYYQEHKNDFTSKSSIKLRILTLKKKGIHEEDALPLSAHLEKKMKGKSEEEFVEAVSLYSDGPNLEEGGELNWVNVEDLREEFSKVITEYKKGQVFGPATTDEAIYFFFIKEYKESHTVSYEEAKSKIRERMLDEEKEKAYHEYIGTLRKNAYIQYFI